MVYRRNLPHWHPEKTAIFITWRLYGSLPAKRPKEHKQDSAGKRFAALDAALDASQQGPLWLKNRNIAGQVTSAVHHGAVTLKFYQLHAFVVMPNHVHLLITPYVPMPRITNGLKGVTARTANRMLSLQENHFWQDESFDHWVRNRSELARITHYIEQNPVRAGLIRQASLWPWSSATNLSEEVTK